ncbi:MAG: DUF2157 domain-containing protein [Rhodoferax sp.]|uniref:DUF2157 domain-containing protein n=1 Tax=Rhodoferax sp. TaxID=50421 RepID=UPI00262BFD17|nr:DUF2157 domain-containing protein [Rhodoferax sp.]MDD2878837.1 DUF2157 domain-containing protein [Rhodoferax sp.]
MSKDFEDTRVIGASPRPSEAPAVDDIFQPGVRLILGWSDIEAAVAAGAIAAAEARPLWARWVADGCVTQAPAVAAASLVKAPSAPQGGPRFSFTNTLYYFGGMVAIGAMSLFMTLGWQSFGAWGLALIGTGYLLACLLVADHLKKRSLPVPAGILATLAVVLVPLVVWSVQHGLGLWPPGGLSSFSAYHTHVNWRWLTLEFATLIAGVVMLWRYRLPFMVMPIAVTLWYMNMDVAHALWTDVGLWDWKFIRDVSLVFGIATVFIALWVDVRCRRATAPEWRQDYAFWLYLFGTLMFWGGLNLRDSDSEIGKAVYCLINVVLVFVGAALGRRVFTVFGGLGVAMYLGYLSYKVFGDSLMFPFALTLLGLGVVALGIWWQRNEERINAAFSSWLPLHQQ